MAERRHARCCAPGTYEHTTPMPISRRVEYVDDCIVDIVAALNAGRLPTVASCCGHGKLPSSVLLDDGRQLLVFETCAQASAVLLRLRKEKGEDDG